MILFSVQQSVAIGIAGNRTSAICVTMKGKIKKARIKPI